MDIDALRTRTRTLVDKALNGIEAGRADASSGKESRFVTALYFLFESKPYVDGAWEMIASDKIPAAFSLSRWVFEAALNLFWVVAGQDEVSQRLTDLAGEALRQDAVLMEDLPKIWPDLEAPLGDRANRARNMKETIGARRIEPLINRMQCIRETSDTTTESNGLGSKLYVLYRISCAATHPGLRVWERSGADASDNTFASPPGNSLLTPDRAAYMAAMSPLNLVSNAYCLTETGDIEELKTWWEDTSVLLD